MDQKIKRTAAGLATALGLLAGAAHAEDITIGYIGASMAFPADAAMSKGFEERAAELGAKAFTIDPKADVIAQANAVDDLISQKVNGIAILPLDSATAQGWVEKINEAGLPMVAVAAQVGDPYKRDWNDVYPGVSALVGKDDKVAGENAAKLALTMLPEGRKAKIAIVEGAPGFVAAVQRSQGFIAGLDAAGADYEITASQPTDWTPEKGEAVCQNILVSNPDIDLFFSHADDMAIGCARAIDGNGSDAKLIATTGGSKLGIAAVAAGELDGTVCMPWQDVGRKAAEALYEAATNPDTATGRVVDVDTPLITAENLDACPPQW